jgi:hypothetical protein
LGGPASTGAGLLGIAGTTAHALMTTGGGLGGSPWANLAFGAAGAFAPPLSRLGMATIKETIKDIPELATNPHAAQIYSTILQGLRVKLTPEPTELMPIEKEP